MIWRGAWAKVKKKTQLLVAWEKTQLNNLEKKTPQLVGREKTQHEFFA